MLFTVVAQQIFCDVPCFFHYIITNVLQLLAMRVYAESLRYMALQMPCLMLV